MSAIAIPPTPVSAPPRGTVPTPHRWTIGEYRKLRETGLFHDVKTMLIHGELYVMTMPKPPHDTALNLAQEIVRSICPTGYHVRNQQGFDVGTDNDPGPDLAVVPGSVRDYATQTPTRAISVVEVADSSLDMDTTTKAELYATAAVPEYWVIDVEHRQLVVFRDPNRSQMLWEKLTPTKHTTGTARRIASRRCADRNPPFSSAICSRNEPKAARPCGRFGYACAGTRGRVPAHATGLTSSFP